MKKLTVMLVAAMMTTVGAYAQDYENKHELAIAYGGWSTSDMLDIYEDLGTIIGTLGAATTDNEKHSGSISAEYFYKTKPWLGVGGIVAYGNSKKDIFIAGTKSDQYKNNYFTVMPAVKFDWLRREHIGLYSKLGIGATIRTMKYNDSSDSEVHVNWQVSALGFEFGSPSFRGFVELGFGEQGTALAGLRYKF